MNARFYQLDVFADRPFEGNQLAVFENGDDVPEAMMPVLAREMNFPESVFLLSDMRPGSDARARIFTPEQELPMAGHPTVGTTFLLAALERIKAPSPLLILDLKIGPTFVDLVWNENGTLHFAWMNQRAPEFGNPLRDDLRAGLASALSLDPSSLLPLPLQTVSSGVPFLFVPVVSEAAVDSAAVDRKALNAVLEEAGEDAPRPVFVFAMSPRPNITFYSRMFAPEFGIPEDPATGGASGPLGCYAFRHGLVDRAQAGDMVSLQGAKMKRPSRIAVSLLTREDGEVLTVRVGGQAIIVGAGEMFCPD
jgi:trans-2,3-dihydro-3-hydroxyanthranilate isomerase